MSNHIKKRKKGRVKKEQLEAIKPGQYPYKKEHGKVLCGRCGLMALIGDLVEYRCPNCRLLIWLDYSIRDNKSYSTGAD